ncbi:MAG: archaellin/type IV pilin N-terminal domain-containing protein [archaeon]
MENKRGLSPVIATVLLIGIVVVIGLVIFLWFRSITQESIIKFDQNIKIICDKVNFQSSYSGGILYISNNGNIPIFNMRIKLSENGNYVTEDLGGWPSSGLNSGDTYSYNIASQISSYNEITLIPVLLGSSKTGDRTFLCEERYGNEIKL